MSQTESIVVTGKDGLRGTLEAPTAPDEGGPRQIAVRLDDGRLITVPADVLVRQDDGSYALGLSAADLEVQGSLRAANNGARIVIPVIVEEIDVQKRTVETGRVRITKVVREGEEIVDEPLLREEVSVERVPVNRVVDGPVPIRHEGDVMIVPVLEEVLYVEKRLLLKEELRISKRRVEEHAPQRVVLRKEEVIVERVNSKPPQDIDGTDIA